MSKKVTNAIKTDKRAVAEKKSKEDLKKQLEIQKKEAEAKALVDGLAGQVTGVYTVDEIKRQTLIALGTKQLALMHDEDKSNDLTKEQIELAKAYIEGKEFKKAQENTLNEYAGIKLRGIAGNDEKVDATKKGKVKDQVQAELKRQYKAGEISKEEYNLLKDESKTAGKFWEFLGFKKNKETTRLYNVTAKTNNRDQRQAELTTGKKEDQAAAVDKYFSADLEAKLEQRGFTPEKLYEIYNANGCSADATANYSYKKKQPGEQHAILAALNNGRKEGDYEFTEEDAKKIGKALGNKWEKAVDYAQVARDTVYGSIGLSPVITVATAETGDKVGATEKTTAKAAAVVPIGTIIGAGTGLAGSVYTQATRVEDRAIPDGVFNDVTTYEEYAKNLDQYATKEGASLGKQIGKYYVKDGVFLKDQLERDLHHAAGTDRADQTPLNYEEADGLLTDLVSGKKVIKAPVKPVEKTEEVVVVETVEKNKKVDQAFCSHEVKKGDNPWAYAYHLYGAKDNAENEAVRREIQELVKKSDPDAAFWKAGVNVELPEEITVKINGEPKTFKIDCEANFNCENQYSSSFTGKSASSAAKLDQVDEKYTVSTTDVYSVKDEQRTHKKNLYEGQSETTAKNKAEEYKKENDNDKNKVTVEIK